jgi:hypothetical protein
LSILHLQTSRINPDRYGQQQYSEGEKVEAIPEGTADLRGEGILFSGGSAVWRRFYLNRNAIAASSGLGLSESVETAQGWRRIAESYHKEWYGAHDRDVVIDDGCKGRAQCFCQLNRFVCSFIAHLPGFLPRSIIVVRFFFISKHLFFLTLLFFASSNVSSWLLLLQCSDPIPQTRSLLFHFCCYRKRMCFFIVVNIFDRGTSPSRVLPSSAIRYSSKVAARRHFTSTNTKGEDYPPMQILLTPVSSVSTLSFPVSSSLSFSSRVVRKENPHQRTSPYPPPWTPVQQSQQ